MGDLGFFGWIIIGLLAGALAGFFVPGRERMGCIGTMLVGIIGGFIGGFLWVNVLGQGEASGWLGALVIATIGSILILIVLRSIPARMRSGPLRWLTASRCGGLRRSRISCGERCGRGVEGAADSRPIALDSSGDPPVARSPLSARAPFVNARSYVRGPAALEREPDSQNDDGYCQFHGGDHA